MAASFNPNIPADSLQDEFLQTTEKLLKATYRQLQHSIKSLKNNNQEINTDLHQEIIDTFKQEISKKSPN